MSEKTMLTQTQIRERGWTLGLIKRFLPEPDKKVKVRLQKNPVHLYNIDRITQVEASDFCLGLAISQRWEIALAMTTKKRVINLFGQSPHSLKSFNLPPCPPFLPLLNSSRCSHFSDSQRRPLNILPVHIILYFSTWHIETMLRVAVKGYSNQGGQA